MSLAVFTLNEPDINGIAAADAAGWYKQNINPLAIKKAFPAVTSSSDAGKGLNWLDAFFSACGTDCYADYVNLVRSLFSSTIRVVLTKPSSTGTAPASTTLSPTSRRRTLASTCVASFDLSPTPSY